MTDAAPDKKVKDEEPDDPVELMLKKTGCIELHYKVQVGSDFLSPWHKYCEMK